MKVYEYDYKLGEIDKKSKTLITHCTFDIEGNILIALAGRYKYVYKYNEANKPVESVWYESDEQYKYEIMKYNKKNIITEKIEEYNHGETLSKTIYKYDDKGNEISCMKYDKDDKLTSESNTINKYDNKNQLVKKTTILASDNKIDTTITIYEYDKNGNMIFRKRWERKYNL